MPDNKDIRHPQDGKRIDVNDPSEVNNWCKIFNCAIEELKKAVASAGTSASAVARYLGKEL